MKKLTLVTLLCLILAGALSAQSVSDKVLFDRATALVKGLRTGTSWNKTIADLKKDFPDLKELEPFKVSEDATVQTQEFGALYNFDSVALKKYTGYKGGTIPHLWFSFYQNKLYRVEVYYFGGYLITELGQKVAFSFFKEDELKETQGYEHTSNYYEGIRTTNMDSDYKQYSSSHQKIGKRIFTKAIIEDKFYADNNLLHPAYGYASIRWNSTIQHVKSIFKDLVETSDAFYSDFGLKEFVQENKGDGDIKRRTFVFDNDSLFEVNVDYKEGDNWGFALDKLQLLYRGDIRFVVYAGMSGGPEISYHKPLKTKNRVKYSINENERKKQEENKKHIINKTDL